ncbi:MAG TPA: type III secretion protein, partial [Acidobacteriaceae bacterium]|nr:type III secretion protein [Acidobacteriaceae bacterium]
QSIPAELYAAVAAILAYLFRQEAEERMRRMHEQQRRTQAAGTVQHAAPPANPLGFSTTQEMQ